MKAYVWLMNSGKREIFQEEAGEDFDGFCAFVIANGLYTSDGNGRIVFPPCVIEKIIESVDIVADDDLSIPVEQVHIASGHVEPKDNPLIRMRK